MSNKAMYNTYHHMRRRCLDSNDPAFSGYGGRGIKVCDRWLEPNGRGLRNFVSDMGKRPEGYSLERIDNFKGYSPDNCVWADRITQNNNTRANRRFTIKGVTKTLANWCKESDVKPSTVRQRFYVYGWSIERSLGIGG